MYRLTEYSTKFEELLKYKKISHWLFGHTHLQYDEYYKGIRFVCNPRGRPNDFNRIQYNLKQIKL